jgi:thioredoxin reductase (NADPH)
VTVLTSTRVCELVASDEVESLQIEDLNSGEKRQLEVDGIFVYIGQSPNTEIFRGVVDLDEAGYVLADEEMRTSVPGVFVAGDVRQKRYRQITTAAGDGTIAALAAAEYLRDLKSGE